MKISFDFDGTLETAKGKQMAKRYIDQGDTVYIVTRRQERDSKAVYEVADELGIPHSRVYFTNGKLKWETLKRIGVDVHYDNNLDEINAIRENTNISARFFKI